MAQAPARCLNHPDRTAIARCKQCHKPLCERCAKKMTGGIYCSDECYQKMNAFQDRVQKLDEARKPGLSIGKLVGRFLVPAIIIVVLYYVLVVEKVRSVGDIIDLIRKLIP
ncbi:hypothetical protein HZA56_12015 [Candidatus Poribacteria bacterium]|nr:hypothetical protein [Candidatus Poribacteria bacterium]